MRTQPERVTYTKTKSCEVFIFARYMALSRKYVCKGLVVLIYVIYRLYPYARIQKGIPLAYT